MRAMFVACCLGLLVGVVASPVHARAFCKSKECQQTSARNAAPKHAATSVQKGARKHATTPVHKLTPKHTASNHAAKHAAKKAASKRPVVYGATRSVHYVVLLSGNHAHKVGVGRYVSNKIIAYRMAA